MIRWIIGVVVIIIIIIIILGLIKVLTKNKDEENKPKSMVKRLIDACCTRKK